PFEKRALFDVNFEIPSHTYQAIIGHTGSGKSTILQHFNALLKPTTGIVQLGDRTVEAGKKAKDLKAVRQRVGIVFQFPE
ncbi:ATP-binding cassette domain-containing protein, partial [Bacillus sp. SIMBA_005]